MYVCMYVCILADMPEYVCLPYMYIFVYLPVYVCILAGMPVYVCLPVCMYVCMCLRRTLLLLAVIN